jgi:hypothetical protein
MFGDCIGVIKEVIERKDVNMPDHYKFDEIRF